MKIECMKNLIYTFVSSITFVLLIGCSAEFENGTPEPWQREINPNENYEYIIKHPCLVNTEADFERARRKVNERAEPWISGWEKLCESRFAQLSYNANPQEEIVRHSQGGNFNTAAFDAGATAVVEGVGDHCCEYMTGGRVVVLGQTGRNFAAGMSGGVAYVWNRDGNFDYFCNMEMVELSLIEEASYRKELHELIRQHYLYTGSKLARTMLDDWPRYADQFIQVVPIEYKKVLQEEQMQKLQQKIAEMQRDY